MNFLKYKTIHYTVNKKIDSYRCFENSFKKILININDDEMNSKKGSKIDSPPRPF